MSASIQYGATVIADIGAGETLTLACGGKKMTDHITVTALGLGGGSLDLSTAPTVQTLEQATDDSPTVVRYQGEIYLLVKEN